MNNEDCLTKCRNYQGAMMDCKRTEKKLKACEQSHADLGKTLDEAIKMAGFYANQSNWLTIMATREEKFSGDKARQFLKSLENDNESKN
jgi:hypothetical protein